MRTASILIREAAYSLLELSGDLEKIEKIEAKPKLFFVATIFHPAYPMTGIFPKAQQAIDAVISVLQEEKIGPKFEQRDSGWFFKSPLGPTVATVTIKKLGDWDDWKTTVPETDTTTWSAR